LGCYGTLDLFVRRTGFIAILDRANSILGRKRRDGHVEQSVSLTLLVAQLFGYGEGLFLKLN